LDVLIFSYKYFTKINKIVDNEIHYNKEKK